MHAAIVAARAVAAMEQDMRTAQNSVTTAEFVGGSLDTLTEAVPTINKTKKLPATSFACIVAHT